MPVSTCDACLANRHRAGVVRRGYYGNEEVAVKVFFPETNVDLFQKELRNWCSVRHPNVVSIYGASTEDGELGMVMELMRQGSLYEYIHKVCDHAALVRIEALYSVLSPLCISLPKSMAGTNS